MRWLSRLVTPPSGLIVDPFMGSGTEGIAAALEGFAYLGAELDPEYHPIAVARVAHAVRWPASWADTAPGYSGSATENEQEELERNGQGRLL